MVRLGGGPEGGGARREDYTTLAFFPLKLKRPHVFFELIFYFRIEFEDAHLFVSLYKGM